MEKKEYSKEIFEKYFSAHGKLLEITLKDNTILEGIFVRFIHGDIDEPYIIKCHFIDKNDIGKQEKSILIDGSEEYGQIIKQEDIKEVKFKI